MNISTYSVTTNEEIQKVMEQNKEDIVLFHYNNYIAMCVSKKWTDKFKHARINWGTEIFGKQLLGNFSNEQVYRGFPQYADEFTLYPPQKVVVVGSWLASTKAKEKDKEIWGKFQIAILKDVEAGSISLALEKIERQLGY